MLTRYKHEKYAFKKVNYTSVFSQAAHEGGGLCAELEYSLKRLVRGLASNRKAARHGYFITLTEVLVNGVYEMCLCTRITRVANGNNKKSIIN